MLKRNVLFDALILFGFLVLLLIFFYPVIFGGKVLLPLDDLYAFQPWRAYASQFDITVPHNHLIGDMIIQNYSWKSFTRQILRQGTIPLWNPYLFAGVPFLAAGQYGVLYPLGLIFYLIPIAHAYGWFTLLHLFLAALFMYIYMRVIGVARLGAVIASISFSFSGFLVVSFLWPQVLSTAVWLPLLVTMVELVVREGERELKEQGGIPSVLYVRRSASSRQLLYAILGSIILGLQFLAGHMEISFYILFTMAFYAACRLLMVFKETHDLRRGIELGLTLVAMVALGFGLAGVQLVPFYELIKANFRRGYVTYEQVIGWALPVKRILSFLMPDFFGNPTHHSYFDLIDWQARAVTENYLGQGINFVEWAPQTLKNYVEGASYVGILPLLLALVALLKARTRYTAIFVAYALFSLLLAFGTPLYRLLFFSIPGMDQLHTPFRWIYPYTFSTCVLAGIGADILARKKKESAGTRRDPLGSLLAWGALGAGVTLIVALVSSRLFAAYTLALVEAVFQRSQSLQSAFASAQMFYSYQFRNVLILALLLVAAGVVIRLSRCSIRLPPWLGGLPVWKMLAVLLLVVDLFLFSASFNSAIDPALLDFVPAAVKFLQEDTELYRIVSLGPDDILPPNTAMAFGIQDARGYDTVIPEQYVKYWRAMEEPHGLLHSKIHKLMDPASLDSPLLDLLNVKYVVTTRHIPNPGYTLVYDDEVRIYRNDDYLPRAFVVPEAKVIEDEEARGQALRVFDPREYVILEEEPPALGGLSQEPGIDSPQVAITEYTINQVTIEADMPQPGWLLLTDSYFPGWKAYDRVGESEEELRIYRADGNFRAVYLEPGEHAVRFKYSPLSFKLGLYVTFLAGVITLVGFGYSLWGHMYREEPKTTIQRVLKNALTPMGTSFLNKGIDTAFAMVMLRILGPEGQGKYGFAIFIVGYFEIVTNFGLDTLLTREVAKDPSQGNRYLSNTAILRLLILLGVLPLLFIFLAVWRGLFALSWDTIAAILLLTLSLIPSSISAALSSLFRAHEKMEYPAAITMVSTILKVTLGLLALLLGFGFVGLAGVSVIVNLVTMSILLYLVMRVFFRPQLEFNPPFSKEMLGLSYPLMINNLLATLFFRVDVTLLQPMKGDTVVGWYTAAYKFIEGVNIIPSTFTIAIFPIISRFAQNARESLIKAYTLAIKALLIVSLPLALLVTFYARGLILIFGGSEYLPHSAIALSLLIWYAPVGFINSVTQYLLIAINQQRFLTRAFLIGLAFNIVANLIFIPQYGYQAAAVITILSEIALFLPFYYGVRKHLTSIPWLSLAWRPTLSTLFMGVFLWWFKGLNFLLLVPSSLLLYLATLVALGTFEQEEIAILKELLPLGRRQEEFPTVE